MDLGLENKVAAVAAASSGLGLAVARELAREGARVFICSRDRERVDRALQQIVAESEPGRVAGTVLDLSTPEAPGRFVREAEERFGAVDILVPNNGGPPPGSPIVNVRSGW